MGTEDKTLTPQKGARVREPLEESVSGLDVRQLLGLGRVAPDAEPLPEAVDIDMPGSGTRLRQAVETRLENAPGEDVVADQARRRPAERRPEPVERQAPPSRRQEEVPSSPPPMPPQRPGRPAFDAFNPEPEPDVQEEMPGRPPELRVDPPVQPPADAGAGVPAGNSQRPIPPVTDLSELPSLRPSIDPMAVNASLSAARPHREDGPASPGPGPGAVDPSIAANAKLEELASLSERTLEDYEAFDDFDDALPKRSKRTSVIILASLLCIGVLAGGVVFAYRQGVKESSQTTLPVIVADTKAAKEEPSNPGGVQIPHQNKLIYDRILGEETDIAEKIVPREEKVATFTRKPAFTTVTKSTPPAKTAVPPVPAAPVTSGAGSKPATGSPSAVANGIKKSVDDAVAGKLAEVVPPKPVSPPDSLINGSGRVSAGAIAEAGGPLTETLKLPSTVQKQVPAGQTEEIVRLETVPVTEPVGSPSAATSAEKSQGETTVIARSVENSAGAGEKTAQTGKVPPVLPRRKPPVPSLESQRVASASPPEATSPSTGARVSAGGGFVIQIAAFRSQEEALSRYAKLKRRHSKLLSPYTSFIQRADLGDRGVYYRLRLGPIDGKDKASKLCRSLLAAGERDCLVRLR